MVRTLYRPASHDRFPLTIYKGSPHYNTTIGFKASAQHILPHRHGFVRNPEAAACPSLFGLTEDPPKSGIKE